MIELSEFVRVAALRSRNFINEAMPTWKKLRPNTPLHVLAYIHFAEPPLAPVHPDLRGWFAPYPTSNLHFPLLDPRQQEPWRRRFAQWPTMNDRLGFYEYFESKPSPNGFYLAANLRAVMARPDHRNALLYAEMSNDRDHDGIGNGEFGWDIGLMNHWVEARLFWDPSQDVDELYHYYIKRTYREAAPQMLEYYAMIKEGWQDQENKTFSSCHASISGVYKGLVIDLLEFGLEVERPPDRCRLGSNRDTAVVHLPTAAGREHRRRVVCRSRLHDYVAEFYVPTKATTVPIAISSGKEIRLLLAKASLVEASVDATLNINPTFALEPVNYAGWMNIATGGQLIQREGKTILDTKYGTTGQMIPLTQPGTYAISATAIGNGYNSIVIIRVYDADGKELMRSSTRRYGPPTYFVPPPEVVYASFLVYSCLLEEVRLVRVGDASANDENRQRQRERCRP